MNKFRSVGYFVNSMLGNDNNKRQSFCELLNFSFLDLTRLCEGRIGLTPVQLEKTAAFFKKPMTEILNYSNNDSYKNMIHCRTDFSEQKNCDKILDIIDSYIDVYEAV